MKTIAKNIPGNPLIMKIKNLVKEHNPEATLILYGSIARGDNRKYSDIDILILVNKDKISIEEENYIINPLYNWAIDNRQVISALVFTKKDWEKRHSRTPFYENIQNDGITL